MAEETQYFDEKENNLPFLNEILFLEEAKMIEKDFSQIGNVKNTRCVSNLYKYIKGFQTGFSGSIEVVKRRRRTLKNSYVSAISFF